MILFPSKRRLCFSPLESSLDLVLSQTINHGRRDSEKLLRWTLEYLWAPGSPSWEHLLRGLQPPAEDSWAAPGRGLQAQAGHREVSLCEWSGAPSGHDPCSLHQAFRLQQPLPALDHSLPRDMGHKLALEASCLSHRALVLKPAAKAEASKFNFLFQGKAVIPLGMRSQSRTRGMFLKNILNKEKLKHSVANTHPASS